MTVHIIKFTNFEYHIENNILAIKSLQIVFKTVKSTFVEILHLDLPKTFEFQTLKLHLQVV